jgi:Tol biopolymer transport system component
MVYQHMTWSPDSQSLAFVRVDQDATDASVNFSALYTVNLEQPEEKIETYTSETEIPFYMYWTPDSQHISFLTNAASGASLLLQRVPAQGGDVEILDAGSPYYWTWAPDSRQMLVHAGGEAGTTNRISFLDVGAGSVQESVLPFSPSRFNTPTFLDGGRILVAEETGAGENSLLLTDRSGRVLETILTFEERVAFSLSPDGKQAAVLTSPTTASGLMPGNLSVIDLENPQNVYTHDEEERVVAFFWAPNGRQLAYFVYQIFEFTPEEEQAAEDAQPPNPVRLPMLQLKVLDTSNNESIELTPFYVGTRAFLNMLPYFDQYAHSATIWSPDSTYLVVSVQPLQSNVPEIWVVPSSGEIEPRRIVAGHLAFWSWE